MNPKSSIRSLPPVVLAVILVVMASAPSALGGDKEHFSALRMVRFAKPVSAPDFALKDLEGNRVSFSRFKGKVLLVNFWTTW